MEHKTEHPISVLTACRLLLSTADRDAELNIDKNTRNALRRMPLIVKSIEDFRMEKQIPYGSIRDIHAFIFTWICNQSYPAEVVMILKHPADNDVFATKVNLATPEPVDAIRCSRSSTQPFTKQSLTTMTGCRLIALAYIRTDVRFGLQHGTPSSWRATTTGRPKRGTLYTVAMHGVTTTWGNPKPADVYDQVSLTTEEVRFATVAVFELPIFMQDHIHKDFQRTPNDPVPQMRNDITLIEGASGNDRKVVFVICSMRYLYMAQTHFPKSSAFRIPWNFTRFVPVGTNDLNFQTYAIIPQNEDACTYLSNRYSSEILQSNQIGSWNARGLAQICADLISSYGEWDEKAKRNRRSKQHTASLPQEFESVYGHNSGSNDCFVWSIVQAIGRAEDAYQHTSLSNALICCLCNTQMADQPALVTDVSDNLRIEACVKARYDPNELSNLLHGVSPYALYDAMNYGKTIPWHALPELMHFDKKLKFERLDAQAANTSNQVTRAMPTVYELLDWTLAIHQGDDHSIASLYDEESVQALAGYLRRQESKDNVVSWLQPQLHRSRKFVQDGVTLVNLYDDKLIHFNVLYTPSTSLWLEAMHLYTRILYYKPTKRDPLKDDAINACGELYHYCNLRDAIQPGSVGEALSVWLYILLMHHPGWAYDNTRLPFCGDDANDLFNPFFLSLTRPNKSTSDLAHPPTTLQKLLNRMLLSLNSTGQFNRHLPMKRIPRKQFPPFCVFVINREQIGDQIATTPIVMSKPTVEEFATIFIHDEETKQHVGYEFTSAVIGKPGHFKCVSRIMRNPAEGWQWFEYDKGDAPKTLVAAKALDEIATQSVILILHKADALVFVDKTTQRKLDEDILEMDKARHTIQAKNDEMKKEERNDKGEIDHKKQLEFLNSQESIY